MSDKLFTPSQLDKLVCATAQIPMFYNEQWREIDFLQEDIEGKYFISNYGRVISLCRQKARVLQPFICGSHGGYYHVSLGKHNYKIHRLVATAFLPNPDPEHNTVVHHKNHDKLNNKVSNLEWVSQSENRNEYFKHVSEQHK